VRFVRLKEVGGGRHNLIAQGEDGDTRFETAGGTEQVTGHRLGGTDGEFAVRHRQKRRQWRAPRRGRPAEWRFAWAFRY